MSEPRFGGRNASMESRGRTNRYSNPPGGHIMHTRAYRLHSEANGPAPSNAQAWGLGLSRQS